jgi:outer membrane receptor for ferrienterochelin and colicin
MNKPPRRNSALVATSVTFLIACSTSAFAQETKGSVEDELLALLNTPITVASTKAMTTRESPGIVTLVTREEILSSGARDLLDVLKMVPGFSFASDTQGVVGVGVRGNWGYEGKTLLLIDGQEMNEIRYATFQLGNHYPVDQIKRIEIIRGPGSAIYGGFAELAVINVITRDGSDLRGVSGALNYGATRGSFTQQTANLAYGNNWNGLDFSISYSGGKGNRSDQPWMAWDLTSRDLKDNSSLNQSFFNLGLKWKGASFRLIQDDYNLKDYTQFLVDTETGLDPPQKMGFAGTYLEFKYDWAISKSFKLVPNLTWKTQRPWYYSALAETDKRDVTRSTFGLQAIYDPTGSLNLVFGTSLSKDEGKTQEAAPWSNGDTTISYTNRVLYGQALLTSDIVNVTLGARAGRNSQFGSYFVPRFALTKAWDIYHVKFLASKAFRSPVIENFELNPIVKPETTTSYEVEFGAQVTSKVFMSVNFFDIKIKDPIVYFYDETMNPPDQYANYTQTGSRGFEFDLQIRGDWGYMHATLATSQANQNEVPQYTVEGQDKYMVGLPNLKATFLASFKIMDSLSFAPSLVTFGPRYCYEYADDGSDYIKANESVSLLNAMLHYRAPGAPLFLSIGTHNMTNARLGFPKGYRGGDGNTYPSEGRDYFIRLGYNF